MIGIARKTVRDLRMGNPRMLAAEIAEQVGVSRERVRQILNSEGLPTRIAPRLRPCKVCGNPITNNNAKYYCSMACLTKDHQVSLVCSICGKPFKIRTCDYEHRLRHKKTNLWFCSKVCQGKWLGQHNRWCNKGEKVK